MIEGTYQDLYNLDSVDKQMIIAFDDGEITNADLYSEGFELTESLCSESELRFGSCEASVIKFKIANGGDSLVNKWLTVSQVLNGQTDAPFQFGKYKVVSDVPSGDKNYRNITAYDSMYDIINTDVTAWYESLTFPITLKVFRNSFFSHFDIAQEEVELVHDDMTIEKTITATSISGKDIIVSVCELNGVFGHINRQGNFVYISLANKIGLYPSVELYPSKSLLPINSLLPVNGAYDTTTETLSKSKYISCEYEDFETSFISKLQIRQDQNDIGVIVGEGPNTYIIEDNFLVYGKEAAELEQIAMKTFEKIHFVQYCPVSVILKGNPCVEVGDSILVHTRNKEVASYILQRTIKGIQSLRDTFSAEGVYEYAEKVNSVQKEVKRLKGKTNLLERTVEETKSELKDAEKNLQTQITQNAESIEAEVKRVINNEVKMEAAIKVNTEGIKQKVSKGSVSSEISQETELISIKSNRISIESDYFKLNPNGSIEAKSGVFTGTFRQYNENGYKSVEILDNQVAIYAWHKNGDYVGSYGALRREEADGSVRSIVSLWCDYGDILSLNYVNPDNPSSKKAVFTYDPKDIAAGHTPWIVNTVGGTLFPDNPGGGIIVENGLIKNWSMNGSTSTIFPNNPGGGIVLKNGLVTSWKLTGANGNLFPNNPGRGVTVTNGLITDFNINRVADSTLNVVTGVYINSEGYPTGFRFTKVVIKDGMFISWSSETKWITEGWMT